MAGSNLRRFPVQCLVGSICLFHVYLHACLVRGAGAIGCSNTLAHAGDEEQGPAVSRRPPPPLLTTAGPLVRWSSQGMPARRSTWLPTPGVRTGRPVTENSGFCRDLASAACLPACLPSAALMGLTECPCRPTTASSSCDTFPPIFPFLPLQPSRRSSPGTRSC